MTYEDGFRDGHSCCAKHAENLQAQLTEALERVAVLEEALEFYADEVNYGCHGETEAVAVYNDDDMGKRARAALAKKDGVG